MSAVPAYLPRYSVADYVQWHGDWELWDGVPASMTPSPFGRHQAVASNLIVQLGGRLRGGPYRVMRELDWVVDSHTIVRPDVIVILGPPPAGHLQTPPVLVAEVTSPATDAKDRGPKKLLYQQQRVPFYLMLDPERQRVDAFQLVEDRYQPQCTDDPLTLTLDPMTTVELDLGEFFS